MKDKSAQNKDIVGIVPCGGLGSRMGSFRYPKELMPVKFERSVENNSIRPKLSIEYSFDAFKSAGIRNTLIVIPDWKPEVIRYVGDGSDFDINVAYLYNAKAAGLADAIYSCYNWAKRHITCLALPDTQFVPLDAFSNLLKTLSSEGADLVLGVFPTEEPEHLAPVHLESGGIVKSLEEKPEYPKYKNTWGIAVWNSIFWDFFKNLDTFKTKNLSITQVFQNAVTSGLKVRGVFFEDGMYSDIGRIDNLEKQLKKLGQLPDDLRNL